MVYTYWPFILIPSRITLWQGIRGSQCFLLISQRNDLLGPIEITTSFFLALSLTFPYTENNVPHSPRCSPTPSKSIINFCLQPVSEIQCQLLTQDKYIDYQPRRRCRVMWRGFLPPHCRRLFHRHCLHLSDLSKSTDKKKHAQRKISIKQGWGCSLDFQSLLFIAALLDCNAHNQVASCSHMVPSVDIEGPGELDVEKWAFW